MDKKVNYSDIKKFCLDLGIDLFGVADISKVKQDFTLSPNTLKNSEKAVCLGMRLSSEILDDMIDQPTRLYSYHYKAVNTFLDQVALKLANYIHDKGFFALPIPVTQILDWQKQKAHLSHKQIGTLSGLGWIGRNNLLVNKKLGSQFRLITVLTNMPLEVDEPTKDNCGTCRFCVQSCPAGAIKEDPADFDHIKCFEKLKEFQKKKIVEQYICGVCVKVCKGKEK